MLTRLASSCILFTPPLLLSYPLLSSPLISSRPPSFKVSARALSQVLEGRNLAWFFRPVCWLCCGNCLLRGSVLLRSPARLMSTHSHARYSLSRILKNISLQWLQLSQSVILLHCSNRFFVVVFFSLEFSKKWISLSLLYDFACWDCEVIGLLSFARDF